jgi:hypothetical protein
MHTAQKFQAEFSSTHDPDTDSVLVLIEDNLQTLADITETCRHYRVQARVVEGEKVVGTVDADGTWKLAP